MAYLNESEASAAYDSLRQILREYDLQWVMEQVEAAIALGKPERRRLSKDDLSEGAWQWVSPKPSRSRGPAPVFVVAEEYTTSERLVLLVEAIRAAVVQPGEFAAAVLDMLPESLSGEGISLQPELESGVGFTIDRAVLLQRRDQLAVLSTLLDELLPDEPNAAPTRIAF